MSCRSWLVSMLAVPVVAAACSGPEAAPPDPRLDAQRAFARMKQLAGEYEAAISGDQGTTTRVVYEVTAGGHALLEKLNDGGDPEMVSMYYLEGEDLALVHYCAIGNRPHLRLDRTTSTIDELRFEWDGTATDVDPAKDAHIHAARFRFPDAATTETEWVFWKDGKEDHTKTFVMVKAPPEAADETASAADAAPAAQAATPPAKE